MSPYCVPGFVPRSSYSFSQLIFSTPPQGCVVDVCCVLATERGNTSLIQGTRTVAQILEVETEAPFCSEATEVAQTYLPTSGSTNTACDLGLTNRMLLPGLRILGGRTVNWLFPAEAGGHAVEVLCWSLRQQPAPANKFWQDFVSAMSRFLWLPLFSESGLQPSQLFLRRPVSLQRISFCQIPPPRLLGPTLSPNSAWGCWPSPL